MLRVCKLAEHTPNTVTSLPESQVHVGYVKIMTIMLLVLELSIPVTGKACFRRHTTLWSGRIAYDENEVSRAFSRPSKSTVMASWLPIAD